MTTHVLWFQLKQDCYIAPCGTDKIYPQLDSVHCYHGDTFVSSLSHICLAYMYLLSEKRKCFSYISLQIAGFTSCTLNAEIYRILVLAVNR